MPTGNVRQVRVLQDNALTYLNIEDYRRQIEEFLLRNLGEMIKPGQKVVIKPNFVRQSHLNRPDDWEYIITHPSVIKLVLEYVVEHLQDSGEVYIVDAPQTDSDFDEILDRTGLPQMVAEIQKSTTVSISYFDLREERWFEKGGVIVGSAKLSGDPLGYVSINLGTDSAFANKQNKEYYGADYDRNETLSYHNEKDNIYVISKTILSCDVFINIPKMKTHKLAGVTGCLKNLVGTCVIKNSIPHHTLGTPNTMGDCYPIADSKVEAESSLKTKAARMLAKKNPLLSYPIAGMKKIAGCFLGASNSETIRNGSWYGNDTIWRSVLDLNKIVIYADKDGVLHDEPQRKCFALVDGVVGGEGNGPMAPDPKESQVLISGASSANVDAVMALLMGFDYRAIPTINMAFETRNKSLPLVNNRYEDIEVISTNDNWNKSITSILKATTLGFRPHFGWAGHIEI